VVILYGARTPEDLLFRRELERWRGRLDVELEVTVDRAGADWRGRVDVVPALLSGRTLDPQRTLAMVCGPEAMMRFTVRALQSMGLSSEHVYVSLERSMRCGVGLCGHCQLLPLFVCKDGPVVRFDRVELFFDRREL
jgi:NAD(P)H-flavin reductase